MSASLYEPVNVYKPLGPDIGVVDGPFEYLTIAGIKLPLPFTTRMTVVRLSNGDLFLHSPIKFASTVAEELRNLGRIRHLVSPNQFHYAHIGEWSKAFPEATTWASPRVRQRARARHADVTFGRDLEADPPEEWRRDMDQTLFPGGYFKEFIFFHQASKTLILTDTIINLELDMIDEPWRTVTKLTGMAYPHGRTFFGMRLPILLHRREAQAVITKFQSWQPRRLGDAVLVSLKLPPTRIRDADRACAPALPAFRRERRMRLLRRRQQARHLRRSACRAGTGSALA